MRAYYNEIEPYAVQWLRNLIDAGHIAKGDVDDRSISDVTPSDLTGYTQCHFFAGIGGWSLALRLAGWDDSRPVWTGSCPCQPFSIAGKGEGVDDERHLWSHWFHLIRAVRPGVIFGEQVEDAVGHGWLDLVQDDLEGEGYAFAPVGVPAASVGAPHIRHRLWFVADTAIARRETRGGNGIRDESRFEQGSIARQGNATAPRDGRGHWSIEPQVGRLADGVPNRVGRLRAYGNAIVPQVAAEVIRAYMECRL